MEWYNISTFTLNQIFQIHFANFHCSQWRKFRQNDDSSVSVYWIQNECFFHPDGSRRKFDIIRGRSIHSLYRICLWRYCYMYLYIVKCARINILGICEQNKEHFDVITSTERRHIARHLCYHITGVCILWLSIMDKRSIIFPCEQIIVNPVYRESDLTSVCW